MGLVMVCNTMPHSDEIRLDEFPHYVQTFPVISFESPVLYLLSPKISMSMVV